MHCIFRTPGTLTALLLAGAISQAQAAPQDRQAFFGDTHVHTNLSFDAYIFGNRNQPEEAYRYAKGEAITHPAGFEMKLREKLDFQAVTDHAMYLGIVPAMYDENSALADLPLARDLREADSLLDRTQAFSAIFASPSPPEGVLDMNIVRSAWQEILSAAERHNDPGNFTAFVGYEFTTAQDRYENLHRNVIFADKAPDEPYSRLISPNPENLWRWMEELRARGMDAIAIPHNSNGSDGYMFRPLTFGGDPIERSHSDLRLRNEPIIEITQVKGTSETHPLLSPTDEFASFEIMKYQIGAFLLSKPQGSYAREALRTGLALEAQGKGNPFQFGFIGASDTHVGAGAFDEDNYWSKIGLIDADGKLRGSVRLSWTELIANYWQGLRYAFRQWMRPPEARTGLPESSDNVFGYRNIIFSSWGASGLAGVWAEENTRASIFAAMRRKEVFATSGPRIRVRLFAGYNLGPELIEDARMVRLAYRRGVPMGGNLRHRPGRTPDFLLWALGDAGSAPLQRLQMVKGWIDADGKTHERVYDVACAGGALPDAGTHRCRDNRAQVDTLTCDYSADTGAGELKAHWQDPDFDPDQNSFYYLRVLENPTCRWSTWDAIRADTKPNPLLAASIQERAWSSPIWYSAP